MGTQLSTSASAMYYDEATASGKDDEWSHAFEVVYEHGYGPCNAGDGHIRQVGEAHLHPRLKELTLSNWHQMGADLGHSAALRKLDLCDCGLTTEHIMALFGDVSRWSACKGLQWINLDGNEELGNEGIAALVPFLKSSAPGLDFLSLNRTNMGDEGAMVLAEALGHNQLWSLSLVENSIGDAGVEALLSVKNAIHLNALTLRHNKLLGQRGVDAITKFLGRGDTDLVYFSLSVQGEEQVKMILDSISKKSKLEDLTFIDDTREIGKAELTKMVAPSLKRLICDTSSFESLCESNHSLQHFYMNDHKVLGTDMDLDLMMALEINAREKLGTRYSEVQKIRAKLRAFYFHGEFDMEPFVSMDVRLMPRVLQLVTKTKKEEDIEDMRYHRAAPEANLGSIFHMLRNRPDIIEPLEESAKEACLKRMNEKRVVSREELLARCAPRNYPEMGALTANDRPVAPPEHLPTRSPSQKRNGGRAVSTEHLHARSSSPSKRTRRGRD